MNCATLGLIWLNFFFFLRKSSSELKEGNMHTPRVSNVFPGGGHYFIVWYVQMPACDDPTYDELLAVSRKQILLKRNIKETVRNWYFTHRLIWSVWVLRWKIIRVLIFWISSFNQNYTQRQKSFEADEKFSLIVNVLYLLTLTHLFCCRRHHQDRRCTGPFSWNSPLQSVTKRRPQKPQLLRCWPNKQTGSIGPICQLSKTFKNTFLAPWKPSISISKKKEMPCMLKSIHSVEFF